MSKKNSTTNPSSSKKEVSKKSAAVESSYPRPQWVLPEHKIAKLVKENPSREGTIAHECWNLIKNGMTVSKYLELGGRIKDLRANYFRGNISLS